MSPKIVIRRLGIEDAPLYRSIRLEALQARPDAFGATWESEREKPLDSSAEALQRNAVFGAFASDALSGIAGFHRLEGTKERHKATLWTMYVRETLRGSGASDLLVDAVIGHARAEVEILLLAVGVHNEGAQRLYRRHGFVEYGREPRALKVDDVYYDEFMMRLDLRP